MDIYIAMYYSPDGDNNSTDVIGGYSDEEKARAACQEAYAEEASYREPRLTEPLEWHDDEAVSYLDDGKYKVVLAELDRAVGQ
jgi:hypothetical protein